MTRMERSRSPDTLTGVSCTVGEQVCAVSRRPQCPRQLRTPCILIETLTCPLTCREHAPAAYASCAELGPHSSNGKLSLGGLTSLLGELLLQLGKLVLDLPQLLLGESLFLFAVLQLLLKILDRLLGVLRAECHVLLDVDLVAGVLLLLFRDGLSLDAEVAPFHDPLLRGNVLTELLVVRNDQHASVVVLDGKHQGSETISVQIVGGLIENEDVRVLPHGSGQDDLNLHATAELTDLGVGSGLGVHAEVAQVLLHGGLRELLGHESGHSCLPLVLALHNLQVAHFNQNVLTAD